MIQIELTDKLPCSFFITSLCRLLNNAAPFYSPVWSQHFSIKVSKGNLRIQDPKCLIAGGTQE